MKKKISSGLLLFFIIALGTFFRFYNVNWDSGYHLHPDERFLVMVGNAMKLPSSFASYLDPQTSLFNPANVGYKFYVYGIFPVVLNKIISLGLETDNYNDFLYQGRILSALFDLFSLMIVFKISSLLTKKHSLGSFVPYLAAFLYAVSVMPIQLSHFFAVDTFLNFFILGSFYYILRFYYDNKNYHQIILSGMLFGFALGSKISAVYALPLLLFFLLFSVLKKNLHSKKILVGKIILILFIFLIPAYLFLRISDPYYFESPNFLDPRPGAIFTGNIKELKAWENPEVLFPPAVQWIHKTPVIYAIKNLVVFGVGIFYFLFFLFGCYLLFRKYHNKEMLAIFFWMTLFFFYQSIQFTKNMRYFIVIYPFLALFGAIGIDQVFKRWGKKALIASLFLVLLWPLCFLSIYIAPMPRVEATNWMNKNVPTSSFLLNEHWDDPLPLRGYGYTGELLPVFEADSPGKWERMNEALKKGDYLILSSNRGWGSIPTVPEKYPQMTKFYQDLFAGKLEYKKTIEFSSFPSLRYLGIPFEFNDQWADESFTVYDHPQVMIFKKY